MSTDKQRRKKSFWDQVYDLVQKTTHLLCFHRYQLANFTILDGDREIIVKSAVVCKKCGKVK